MSNPKPSFMPSLKSPAVSTGSGFTASAFAMSELPSLDPTDALAFQEEKAKQEGRASDGGKEFDISSILPEDKERRITKDGKEYILNALGLPTWCNKPFTTNQYNRPELIRRDPPKTEVFNLGLSEDLEKLNELQSGLIPGGPSVELISQEIKFHEGVFYTLIIYTKVWYRLPIN